jgi:hypothetical protein
MNTTITTSETDEDHDDTADEWSGSCDPCDPANYWIDDETGERVDAVTGDRTTHDCPGLNADGSVKDEYLD